MRMKFSRDRPLAAQYFGNGPYVELGGVLATAHGGARVPRRHAGLSASRCKSNCCVFSQTILDVRLQTMGNDDSRRSIS